MKSITKQDRENLIEFLEEYLKVFKNNKKHQKIHKKEPCYKCELAKGLLKKLKMKNPLINFLYYSSIVIAIVAIILIIYAILVKIG